MKWKCNSRRLWDWRVSSRGVWTILNKGGLSWLRMQYFTTVMTSREQWGTWEFEGTWESGEFEMNLFSQRHLNTQSWEFLRKTLSQFQAQSENNNANTPTYKKVQHFRDNPEVCPAWFFVNLLLTWKLNLKC